MMSLTPMAPSAWRYYVEEIAHGREDYYAVSAERQGHFVGRGASSLGVEGRDANALSLERLFGHGTDPRDGSPLGRSFDPDNPRAVAGFALTFSPPKSVSTLWALADENTSNHVLAAHEAAVASAFAFVDDHAAFTRRGHNGVLQVDTDGLIAAGFIHRTSRAADPQLHTHLLVANKVRAGDSKWLSIDGRELFETQKAAGMLYKAALRAELVARLGVQWTAVDNNGAAEILGVPPMLIEHWSARRHELTAVGAELIANREVELGRSLSANERAECFQIAAYRTRTPKVDAGTPTAELRSHWRAEAEAWGLGPERWLADVTGRPRGAMDVRAEDVVPAVIDRLEEKSATWGRADAIEELTRVLTGKDADEVRERAEILADQVLRDAEVVSLAGPLPAEVPTSLRRQDGMAAIERHGAVRFSTRATLQREVAILERVAAGQGARAAVVDERVVERELTTSVLGEDQREAVHGLLTGGERVALLVGPAGTGKSRALDTARAGWERAGYEPIGLAPSTMAAAVLSEEAGLSSETLAKFLVETDRENSPLRLDRRSVVILDEAGMARTDDLAQLLRVVEAAKAKLVLVGDPHQLGAVGPGGIFRTLVADHGAHELETVRRFHHAWEAAASLRLRDRDPAILPTYVRHDRIAGGSREQMIDRAFAAWREAREEGTSLLLMAGDNVTADELSRRCRAELVARGVVHRDGVRIATGTAGYGDEVVTLKNDRRLRPTRDDFVRNGARWQVVGIFPDGSMRVVSDDGGGVTLPPDYVREHVALGYALTIHKAQGKTADRAIALVEQKMTAAQLYVAMSRGREENRAFVICSDDELEDHVRRPSVDALEALARIMCRDEVDRSANDVLRRGLARYEDIALLDALHEEALREITASAGADNSEQITALEPKANVAGAVESLHRAEEHLGYAEVRRREAEDRFAEVEREPMRARLPGRFGADARHRADEVKRHATGTIDETRRFEQEDLRRMEAARSRLTDAERAAKELERLREVQTRRESWLLAHPEEVRWELDLRRRIRERLAERGEARLNAHIAGRVPENPSIGPLRLPHAREVSAVEKAAKRAPTPPHVYAPSPSRRGSEREGPALGL